MCCDAKGRLAEADAHSKVAKTINSEDAQSFDMIYARLSSYYDESSPRLRALQALLMEFDALLQFDQDEPRRPSWWLDVGEVSRCLREYF